MAPSGQIAYLCPDGPGFWKSPADSGEAEHSLQGEGERCGTSRVECPSEIKQVGLPRALLDGPKELLEILADNGFEHCLGSLVGF